MAGSGVALPARRSGRSLGSMDAMSLIFGLAILLGWPVLIIELLLCIPRRTRYFLIPVLAGAIPGALVAIANWETAPGRLFLGTYTVIAAPIGAICGFVALIDAWERRDRGTNAA